MRILIATGSSGGHIFPAVALHQALEKSGHELLLVLPQTALLTLLPVPQEEIKYIPAVELSFKFNRKTVLGIFAFLRSTWVSLRIILKFKPDVVVGFGSLNTIAVVFWAWLFRVKTVIHEQNVICGRANRLLAKLADKVAVSFPQTRSFLNIAREKIVLTGNPLRREMERVEKEKSLEFFNFKKGRTTILITGGSQGAHRINSCAWEALYGFAEKDSLQLIHICGRQDFKGLKERYSSSGIEFRLYEFFPQMQYAYSASDLAISRAGATTVAELQKFKVPAILVPYPYAYAHQFANAAVLEGSGAAVILRDEELSAEILRGEIKDLLARPGKLESMAQAYPDPGSSAAQLLAQEVLSVVSN